MNYHVGLLLALVDTTDRTQSPPIITYLSLMQRKDDFRLQSAEALSGAVSPLGGVTFCFLDPDHATLSHHK